MSKKILVIDDDDTVIEFIKTGLGAYGYDVVGTTESLKAIEQAHAEKPDAIVLDFVMPGIDGYSVYKGLSASSVTKNIPVLFISGHMTREILAKITQTRAYGYMLKPFEIYNLKERIEDILNKREKEKQSHI
jgi:DNA-binding response OmpR family regulator